MLRRLWFFARRCDEVRFPEVSVAPGCSTNLTIYPDRLHVSRAVLDEVAVRNLEVRTWVEGEGAGDYLSRVRSENLAASLRDDGWFPDLRGLSVGPRSCLVVHVENKTQLPANFTGAVLGGPPY